VVHAGIDKCVDLPELHDGSEFAGPVCFWRSVDMGIAVGVCGKGRVYAQYRQ